MGYCSLAGDVVDEQVCAAHSGGFMHQRRTDGRTDGRTDAYRTALFRLEYLREYCTDLYEILTHG